jgi:DnaJ homolog subfamily A member 2
MLLSSFCFKCSPPRFLWSFAVPQHHPDKGGDEETFKEITTAFEVLGDDEKRQIYNEYGEEGLKEGGGGHQNPHDIFEAMFGGGMFGGGQQRGPRKGEDVVHTLNVTLEDLYNGKMSKLAIIRNRVCLPCKGTGASRPEAVKACSSCDGSGVRVMLNPIGPGMVQQVQTRCPSCSGLGETIADRYKCTSCGGSKVSKERKVLEVYVDRGMSNGQKIVFSGEANENPGLVAGDVVVVLKQAQHETFTRRGGNLIVEREISLTDALCGFKFGIRQLDGRMLIVTSTPGSVITPGDVKSIPVEGMPTWKRPDDRGYMFVKFKVAFPKFVGPQEAAQLEAVLGPKTPLRVPPGSIDNMEEVQLLEFNQEHARTRETANEYDEDEDEGGRRVNCANQ